jgi:putative endonuclease
VNSLYFLRCADGSLYCGVAQDLAKRVGEHNGEGGSKKGAKYTRSRRPVTLVWSRRFRTKSAALRAEASLKKLSRAEKLALVAGASDLPRPARKNSGRGEKNSSAGHRPSKAKRG